MDDKEFRSLLGISDDVPPTTAMSDAEFKALVFGADSDASACAAIAAPGSYRKEFREFLRLLSYDKSIPATTDTKRISADDTDEEFLALLESLANGRRETTGQHRELAESWASTYDLDNGTITVFYDAKSKTYDVVAHKRYGRESIPLTPRDVKYIAHKLASYTGETKRKQSPWPKANETLDQWQQRTSH